MKMIKQLYFYLAVDKNTHMLDQTFSLLKQLCRYSQAIDSDHLYVSAAA